MLKHSVKDITIYVRKEIDIENYYSFYAEKANGEIKLFELEQFGNNWYVPNSTEWKVEYIEAHPKYLKLRGIPLPEVPVGKNET